jgi:molybdenum cofactor biosynthesis protein MoaC
MTAVVYPFEQIDETLPFMPLAVRRVLDATGRKLSLAGWLSLSVDERWLVARAGAEATIQAAALSIVDRAVPPAAHVDPVPEPDGVSPPPDLVAALGTARPLDPHAWSLLRPLDRYALVKSAPNGEKLDRAYDELVGRGLTHLAPDGSAHMVDVGAKPTTRRTAVASARVCTTTRVVQSIGAGDTSKGDVLAAARIAGILAAKRTPELIPLCHPLHTTRAAVEFELDAARGELRVRSTVEALDRTGVEMEAMVAASVAALTVYDMIKSLDRWARIEAVGLETKSGGKSGHLQRPPERALR